MAVWLEGGTADVLGGHGGCSRLVRTGGEHVGGVRLSEVQREFARMSSRGYRSWSFVGLYVGRFLCGHLAKPVDSFTLEVLAVGRCFCVLAGNAGYVDDRFIDDLR